MDGVAGGQHSQDASIAGLERRRSDDQVGGLARIEPTGAVSDGQLGDPTVVGSTIAPTAVAGLTDAVSIGLGA